MNLSLKLFSFSQFLRETISQFQGNDRCRWALIFSTFSLRFSSRFIFFLFLWMPFKCEKSHCSNEPRSSGVSRCFNLRHVEETEKEFRETFVSIWFTRCLKVFSWDFFVSLHRQDYLVEEDTRSEGNIVQCQGEMFVISLEWHLKPSHTSLNCIIHIFRRKSLQRFLSARKENIDFSFQAMPQNFHRNPTQWKWETFSSLLIRICCSMSDSMRPKINTQRNFQSGREVTHVDEIHICGLFIERGGGWKRYMSLRALEFVWFQNTSSKVFAENGIQRTQIYANWILKVSPGPRNSRNSFAIMRQWRLITLNCSVMETFAWL